MAKKSPFLQGKDGQQYRLSQLRKTAEFGGKGEGSGTRIEDQQIKYLNAELDEIKIEIQAPTVPVSIANTIYQVATVEKTFGTPKSDIELHGDEIVYISHKGGYDVRHFQQWGGMTDFWHHEEVLDFTYTVKNKFPDGMIPGHTVARPIVDKDLQNRSVYGLDYGNTTFGINNVNYLIQGEMQLIKCDNYYTLSANSIHKNGDKMHNQYEPILFARFNSDRSQYVTNCRMLICPAGSRNVKEWI